MWVKLTKPGLGLDSILLLLGIFKNLKFICNRNLGAGELINTEFLPSAMVEFLSSYTILDHIVTILICRAWLMYHVTKLCKQVDSYL